MASPNWLEFRSGAPHFQGPTLLEFRQAYEVFDAFVLPPRMLLAIGGETKRHFFQSHHLKTSASAEAGVALRPFNSSTILIDCELHNVSAFKSRKAGPLLGNCLQHHLHVPLTSNSPKSKISSLAQDLYWQILFPFASVVLLFIDDLGGASHLLELLAEWVRKSTLDSGPCPPRILIVYDWRSNINPQQFGDQLRARLRAFLSGTSDSAACRIASESMQLFSFSTSLPKLLLHIEEAFSVRDKLGFAFNPEHLRELLQIAVNQTGQGSSQQFDVQDAVRLRNPPSPNFADHISRFIMMSQHVGFAHDNIIASALQLDAHPPGMHFFQPSSTFDKHYFPAISAVETTVKDRGLRLRIRDRFIKLSFEREHGSAARAHLRLLREYQAYWGTCHSEISCLICLARYAHGNNALSCGHRLCDSCVIISGSPVLGEPWAFSIRHCPLCGESHDEPIRLRPPTAGLRVLELRGSVSEKEAMWQFLKALQRALGLPLSLRDQFDVAIGYDLGAYFIQTVFLEGWTLADCKYHFRKLSDPKINKKRTAVSFGKDLEWEISEGKHKGTSALGQGRFKSPAILLQVKNQKVSNTPESIGMFDELKEDSSSHDVRVQHQGYGYTIESLRPLANQLTACLFYIELISVPSFYTVPDSVRVRLQCRLSPGPALMSLIRGLYERKARVYYQGDEAGQRVDTLVTAASLSNCRKSKCFSKTLEMRATSMKSRLSIRVEPGTGCRENISNCPYELQRLVQDQGVDCPFGRNDHSIYSSSEGGGSEEMVEEEINELRATLDGIILSWNSANS